MSMYMYVHYVVDSLTDTRFLHLIDVVNFQQHRQYDNKSVRQ